MPGVLSVCFESAAIVTMSSPDAQLYEYGRLSEIKPKLESRHWEEREMLRCAIANNIGVLCVSTEREEK